MAILPRTRGRRTCPPKHCWRVCELAPTLRKIFGIWSWTCVCAAVCRSPPSICELGDLNTNTQGGITPNSSHRRLSKQCSTSVLSCCRLRSCVLRGVEKRIHWNVRYIHSYTEILYSNENERYSITHGDKGESEITVSKTGKSHDECIHQTLQFHFPKVQDQ